MRLVLAPVLVLFHGQEYDLVLAPVLVLFHGQECDQAETEASALESKPLCVLVGRWCTRMSPQAYDGWLVKRWGG